MSNVAIRPPTFSKASQPSDFALPSIAWLSEEWRVTHSSLPMWRKKRNVRIKYTPLAPANPSLELENTDRMDDLVSYQALDSNKLHTVHGVDKWAGSGTKEGRGEWDWRGKGWLVIAGSHWEVLGWGEEAQTGNKWVVTCFAKTMFTPAGIDVYSKDVDGVQSATLEQIKKELSEVGDGDVQKMAETIFQIRWDER